MTEIILKTTINAPIETCFDLAINIDIHQLSTAKTNEIAIAGRTSGLCELNDEITWEAKHFGIKQRLTVKITHLEFPIQFEDRMLKGAFKSMHHIHRFEFENNQTIMHDSFKYEVPFGVFGKIFNTFVLKSYMTKFLKERNRVLKEIAETH